MDAHDFIRRWANASIGERAHCHTFIQQLCDLIGAPAPVSAAPARGRADDLSDDDEPPVTIAILP